MRMRLIALTIAVAFGLGAWALPQTPEATAEPLEPTCYEIYLHAMDACDDRRCSQEATCDMHLCQCYVEDVVTSCHYHCDNCL